MNLCPCGVIMQKNEDKSDCVILALNHFHGINVGIIYVLFKWMPILLSLAIIITVIFTWDTYLMFLTAMLSLIAIFLIFNDLMDNIPECLLDIWMRCAVIAKNSEYQGDGGDPRLEGSDPASKALALRKRTMNSYKRFIADFELHLNSRIQLIIGLIFAIFLSIRSFYEFWISLPSNTMDWLPVEAGGPIAVFEILRINLLYYLTIHAITEPLEFISGLLLEPLLGFAVGIALFKMAVVGWEIWHMRDFVSFKPQPDHQDRCGGLGPLGKLCLYNATILGLAGLFLGGWIILGPETKYGDYYTPLFLAWLPIPLISSILCFFLPLINVHWSMQSSQNEIWKAMDRLSYEITILKQNILYEMNNSTAKGAEEKINNLKFMKEVYQENIKYPVWPFDKQMLMKFLTTQSVTILVLVYSAVTNGLNSASQPAFDLVGGTISIIGGP